MPATAATCRIFMGIDPASPVDQEALDAAVAAANDLVTTYRPDLTTTEPWAPRAEFAANLQGAHLYGRRGSIQGIAAFADLGVTNLPRLDPDVRTLLELGDFQPSVVS